MNLLQQVEYDDLVEGQKYFVIHRRSAVVEGDLIYDGNHFFKYPNSKKIFQLMTMYNFYRYVSKGEYYSKLKEKYNQTCLDIILKRLLDENFEW